jgi:hypothetical protein
MEIIYIKQETEKLKKNISEYLDMVVELLKPDVREDNVVLERNESILQKGKEVLNSQNEPKFKVGDKVELLLDSSCIGTIKYIDTTTMVHSYYVSWKSKTYNYEGWATESQFKPFVEKNKEELPRIKSHEQFIKERNELHGKVIEVSKKLDEHLINFLTTFL